MGVGEVSGRLREPLDAAGNQYVPRYRAMEKPVWLNGRRAPYCQTQPRFFCDCGFAGGQQYCAAPTAISPRPNAASIYCARLLKKPSIHMPINILRNRLAWMKAKHLMPIMRSNRFAIKTRF